MTLLLISALLSSTARAESATESGNSTELRWTLSGSLACVFYPCASFQPTREGPALELGLFDLQITTPGILTTGDSEVRLVEKRDRHLYDLTLSGNARYALNERGVILLSPSSTDYDHRERGGASSDPRSVPTVSVPGLTAMAEGTHFEVLTTAGGSTCVLVHSGRVRVTTGLSEQETSIRAGEGACIFLPQQPDGSLSILGGEDALARFQSLLIGGDRAAAGRKEALAYIAFSSRLSTMPLERITEEALTLAQRYPEADESARALYSALLFAEARGDDHGREVLLERLADQFPDGRWTRLALNER